MSKRSCRQSSLLSLGIKGYVVEEMKARMGELSLPVNNPLIMIIESKIRLTLSTRSWSVQVIVVHQIGKAQISLSPAKSWQLQSVCSLVKLGMYKHSDSANIPGSLFVRQDISFERKGTLSFITESYKFPSLSYMSFEIASHTYGFWRPMAG